MVRHLVLMCRKETAHSLTLTRTILIKLKVLQVLFPCVIICV